MRNDIFQTLLISLFSLLFRLPKPETFEFKLVKTLFEKTNSASDFCGNEMLRFCKAARVVLRKHPQLDLWFSFSFSRYEVSTCFCFHFGCNA